MTDQEKKRLEDRITALEDGQKDILLLIKGISDSLKPLTETFEAASKIGKWFMAFLVFISIMIGIIVGLKDIIHK